MHNPLTHFLKKALLLVVASLFITWCSAQTASPCRVVKLDTEEHIKEAEPCVLIAANDILSRPLSGNDQTYHEQRAFILSWADKTSDYTFALNGKIVSICEEKDNMLLFGVYIACMAKAALEAKSSEIGTKAVELFVSYVSDPDNGVKKTGKIKKLISDQKAGNLDKYIN